MNSGKSYMHSDQPQSTGGLGTLVRACRTLSWPSDISALTPGQWVECECHAGLGLSLGGGWWCGKAQSLRHGRLNSLSVNHEQVLCSAANVHAHSQACPWAGGWGPVWPACLFHWQSVAPCISFGLGVFSPLLLWTCWALMCLKMDPFYISSAKPEGSSVLFVAVR